MGLLGIWDADAGVKPIRDRAASRNGIVAAGTREVDDDLGFVFEFGMDFAVDGGKGAED